MLALLQLVQQEDDPLARQQLSSFAASLGV